MFARGTRVLAGTIVCHKPRSIHGAPHNGNVKTLCLRVCFVEPRRIAFGSSIAAGKSCCVCYRTNKQNSIVLKNCFITTLNRRREIVVCLLAHPPKIFHRSFESVEVSPPVFHELQKWPPVQGSPMLNHMFHPRQTPIVQGFQGCLVE